MKTKSVTSVWLGIMTGLFLAGSAPILQGQPALDPAEKVNRERQLTEERLRAFQEQNKKANSTGGYQKQLDKLGDDKVRIEKDVDLARTRLNYSTRLYQAAVKTGEPDEIERYSKEIATWNVKLQAAEVELQKVDAQTQDVIKGLKASMEAASASSIILPGDALQVFVLEDDSFNGLYQVRRGGYIIMPRVGRVSVVGKDMSGAEKAVKEALEQNQLRQGTVMIERTQTRTEEEGAGVIYLAGEFNTPGPLRLPPNFAPTLVTIVLRSGGVTPSADLSKVRLLRLENGKGLVEEVDVQSILEGTGLQSDLALLPGDIVVVPGYAQIAYVTGNVKKPGVVKLFQDEEMTAYAAILRAEGFARFASLSKVYVLRDHGNGEKSKIPVNIKDVQAGKAADVVLRGKDIVVVPEKFFSW
ncbi:MAG: SLBB domain-containing protein [Verrucomicrobia bacterium]|nr:SLBB domain-containing protein [Verrucomicrobiota bacterium]